MSFQLEGEQLAGVEEVLPALIWLKVCEFARDLGISLPTAASGDAAAELIRAPGRVGVAMLGREVEVVGEAALVVAGELVVWDELDGSSPTPVAVLPPAPPKATESRNISQAGRPKSKLRGNIPEWPKGTPSP